VASQVETCRNLAQARWPGVPVGAYVDNDISAAKPGTVRPAYNDLVAAIRRREVAQLVCVEQSRLTRQPAEMEQLWIILGTAGIENVYTSRTGVVPVKGSRLVGRILAAVDAEEVERTRLRILDSKDALAAAGRPAGGTLYGYRTKETDSGPVRVQHPDEAATVRWAADRVLAGWSLGAVAADLAERKVPTRRGGRWATQNVRSMLTSPATAGLRVHRGEIVGPGAWDPILEADTWRRVRELLSRGRTVRDVAGGARRTSSVHRRPRRYLLTGGLARCGRCGTSLTAQRRVARNGEPRPCYLCDAKRGGCNGIGIGAEELEEYVARSALRRLAVGELPAVADHASERADLQRTLDDLHARRLDIAEAAARVDGDGVISVEEWLTLRNAIGTKEDDVKARLADLPADDTISADLVLGQWPMMPLHERRRALDQMIHEVVVNPAKPGRSIFDRVVIRWR